MWYRRVEALLKHEAELLKGAITKWPIANKLYKEGYHYGYVLYWWLVGLFAHGPYAYVALGMGVLILLHPLFEGGD